MSLGHRLRRARERSFVGRAAELEVFRSALAGGPGAPSLIYVHGLGGVGKSTLLRRFVDEAAAVGRNVVAIDCRAIDPSPAGFIAAAEGIDGDGSVLLVDTFERAQGLEDWLREQLLPGLPGDAVVVIASREPPSAAWLSDLAWSDVLHVVALGDLDTDDATELLAARGVPSDTRQTIADFAGGHPLALSLAAALAATGDGMADWTPTPDVLASLVAQIVGETPSPKHRAALEAAAHAMVTTEGLVRTIVGDEHAGDVFAWLRRQPFTERSATGLIVHDLVADAVDSDLRWRDPDGYEDMHRRVGAHLLGQARAASGPEVVRALRELLYLKRYGPVAAYYLPLERGGHVYEDVLRPGDHDTVRRMTAEAEGEASSAVVDLWLERQPQAFWVYRSAGSDEVVGFFTWLRLTERLDDEIAADPVVAAAWTHIDSVGPLRPGEHVRMARFFVRPDSYHQVSHLGCLMNLRMCVDFVRPSGMAWSFIVTPEPDVWMGLMRHYEHRPAVDVAWPNGQDFTLFVCEWRAVPTDEWLARTLPGGIGADTTPELAEGDSAARLSRAAFDEAVRAALRDWHRPADLVTNPLIASRMVARAAGDTPHDAVGVLRDLISEAVAAIEADPREAKFHRVVDMTYLQRVPTQEAAAERLDLPFSTYRRHLRRGSDLVVEELWRLETGAIGHHTARS